MNFVQAFVTLAFFAITTISAIPQLVISNSLVGANFAFGTPITFTVSSSDGVTPISSFTANFVDEYGNTASSFVFFGTYVSLTSTTLIGTVSATVVPTDQNAFKSSLPVAFNVYSSLSVVTPASPSTITYGAPVILLVSTNAPYPVSTVQYTASFSCPTGSYQITGLTTGISYELVPAGLYGQVVVTVTAANNSPGTAAFTIFKPSNNIPPAFIPGRLPYYPSVYANMKDGKTLEIVSVDYSEKSSI